MNTKARVPLALFVIFQLSVTLLFKVMGAEKTSSLIALSAFLFLSEGDLTDCFVLILFKISFNIYHESNFNTVSS